MKLRRRAHYEWATDCLKYAGAGEVSKDGQGLAATMFLAGVAVAIRHPEYAQQFYNNLLENQGPETPGAMDDFVLAHPLEKFIE